MEAGRAGLQAEVERLRAELGSTRQTIVRLHDRWDTNSLLTPVSSSELL